MSPRLNLDLTQAEEFGEMPDGPYRCDITGAEPTKAKSTGTPMLTVEFTVNEGEYAGRKFWRNYMLAGKGAGFTADFWERVTGEKPDFAAGNVDLDTDDIVGEECIVINSPREYEGQMQNNVARVLSVTD